MAMAEGACPFEARRVYFRVWRSSRCVAKLSLRCKTSHRRRPEYNETRFFASIPPYRDIAIVFNTFVWTGMVRRPIDQPRNRLEPCRTSCDPARWRNDSESLDTSEPDPMRI